MVGLNHRTAPLAVREGLAFDPQRAADTLRGISDRFPGTEAVIVSTCNRVELYIARPVGTHPSRERLWEVLVQGRQLTLADIQEHLYHHEDRAMVEHLFAVASSLDSMVVGETQILAQVKNAYQAACQAGTVGSTFHALFQRALAAAKDVHESTQLAAGRLSVASVAVDLVQRVFDEFADKTVLCIGAGEMVALLLRHMQELKPRQMVLANRSLARAQELAAQVGGMAAPLEHLETLLVDADIILSSTGATEPLVTAGMFKKLLKARKYRPAVIVDIAVPRDIDPEVGKLTNVYLYNIDDLQQVAAVNRDKRTDEIDRSRELLVRHVDEFVHWFAARDVGPLVKALYDQCNAIARAELEQVFARHPEYDEAQRKEWQRLTHRLVGKMLHAPVAQITQQAEATARPMLAAALKKLFSLGDAGPAKEDDGMTEEKAEGGSSSQKPEARSQNAEDTK